MIRKRVGWLFLILCALGCGLFPGEPEAKKQLVRLYYQEVLLGYSVNGVHIPGTVFGEGEDCILFIGVVHGDEPGGGFLLDAFIDYLKQAPERLEGRRIVVIPKLNPDGEERGSRFNANRVDLNRNFPSRNWGEGVPRIRSGQEPGSEPETQIIVKALKRFAPERIVVIHSAEGCIDYDGPALDLAQAMAEKSDLPVRKLGAKPGSLGSYAGLDLGLPVITMELLQKVKRREEVFDLWNKYKDTLLEAIHFPCDQTLIRELNR